MIDHWQSRQGIITMHSTQCGKNPILRLGDSISEGVWVGLPGKPPIERNTNVLNAGFMGMRVADFAPFRDYALGICNPWAVLFQMGTNDAAAAKVFDLNTWAAAFESHIAAIAHHPGVSLVAVKSVPPILNARCGYDAARINAMNGKIEEICKRYKNAFWVNLDPYLKCQSTGFARPGYLLDAVHLAGHPAMIVAWLDYCACNWQALPPPPPPC